MQKAARKILIIDDEVDVTRAVRLTITLQEPHWQVIETHNGEQGLLALDKEAPDLVLLDLVMPHDSGFEVLKDIRLFSDTPVIILTVQDDEMDKVHGLELGADDYIVKPFGHLELMARIRSVLRRAEGMMEKIEAPFVSGDLRIDYQRRQVTIKGKVVKLTSTEYRLLEILARNAGRVVSSEILLRRVWGRYALDGGDYLKVYIHRLRQKIEADPTHPQYLQTLRGEGYWLSLERE